MADVKEVHWRVFMTGRQYGGLGPLVPVLAWSHTHCLTLANPTASLRSSSEMPTPIQRGSCGNLSEHV